MYYQKKCANFYDNAMIHIWIGWQGRFMGNREITLKKTKPFLPLLLEQTREKSLCGLLNRFVR